MNFEPSSAIAPRSDPDTLFRFRDFLLPAAILEKTQWMQNPLLILAAKRSSGAWSRNLNLGLNLLCLLLALLFLCLPIPGSLYQLLYPKQGSLTSATSLSPVSLLLIPLENGWALHFLLAFSLVRAHLFSARAFRFLEQLNSKSMVNLQSAPITRADAFLHQFLLVRPSARMTVGVACLIGFVGLFGYKLRGAPFFDRDFISQAVCLTMTLALSWPAAAGQFCMEFSTRAGAGGVVLRLTNLTSWLYTGLTALGLTDLVRHSSELIARGDQRLTIGYIVLTCALLLGVCFILGRSIYRHSTLIASQNLARNDPDAWVPSEVSLGAFELLAIWAWIWFRPRGIVNALNQEKRSAGRLHLLSAVLFGLCFFGATVIVESKLAPEEWRRINLFHGFFGWRSFIFWPAQFGLIVIPAFALYTVFTIGDSKTWQPSVTRNLFLAWNLMSLAVITILLSASEVVADTADLNWGPDDLRLIRSTLFHPIFRPLSILPDALAIWSVAAAFLLRLNASPLRDWASARRPLIAVVSGVVLGTAWQGFLTLEMIVRSSLLRPFYPPQLSDPSGAIYVDPILLGTGMDLLSFLLHLIPVIGVIAVSARTLESVFAQLDRISESVSERLEPSPS